MNPDLDHTRARRAIRAHFGRGNNRETEHSMFEHISDCTTCRSVFEHYAALTTIDPNGMPRHDRLLRGLRLRKRRLLTLAPLIAATAGVAATVAFVIVTQQQNTGGFRSRGAMEERPEVQIYRIIDGGAEIVTDHVSSTDALAFAYTDTDKARYLLIFARSANGEIHWYHPAWTDPDDNPRAVSITRANNLRELGEAVQHRLAPGRTEILTIFADDPWSVREIEAAIANLAPGASLELPGAHIQGRWLTVEQ